jgi:hypothetical protein
MIEIIKLADRISGKYLIKEGQVSQIERDVKNGLSTLMDDMVRDNISARITLGYEGGILTWFLGAKIEIKKIQWSSTEPDLVNKYKKKFEDIVRFVNKPGMKYEGGPWTFVVPN